MSAPEIQVLERRANQRHGTRGFKERDIPTFADDFEDLFVVEKANWEVMHFMFENIGANGADFEVYGTAETNPVPKSFPAESGTPPPYSTVDWVLLPNGSFTVAGSATAARSCTDEWKWILVRGKRENVGEDTAGAVYIRGRF